MVADHQGGRHKDKGRVERLSRLVHVAFGSFATDAVNARGPLTSAVDPKGDGVPTKVGNDHLSFSINRRAWGDGTQSVVSIPGGRERVLFLRGIKRRSAVVERADGRGATPSPFA